MKVKIAAIAALAALCCAPALAQSAAPAATCQRPALEPYPPIPAANAKPPEVATAQKVYLTWHNTQNDYLGCLEKQLGDLKGQADAVEQSSPEGKLLAEYDPISKAFNDEYDALKKGGVEPTIGEVKLVPKGKPCPPAPALTPPPAAPPPVDKPSQADRKQVADAKAAFAAWAPPYYVYLKCAEPLRAKAVTVLQPQLNAIVAQQNAIIGEHNDLLDKVNAFDAKWKEFATTYNGR